MTHVWVHVRSFDRVDHTAPGTCCGNHSPMHKPHRLPAGDTAYYATSMDGNPMVFGSGCAASIAKEQGIDLTRIPNWTKRDCDEGQGLAPTRSAFNGSAGHSARREQKATVYLDMMRHLDRLLFNPAKFRPLPLQFYMSIGSGQPLNDRDVDIILRAERGALLNLQDVRTLNKLIRHFQFTIERGRKESAHDPRLRRGIGIMASMLGRFQSIRNPRNLAFFSQPQMGVAQGCAARLGMPLNYFSLAEFQAFMKPPPQHAPGVKKELPGLTLE